MATISDIAKHCKLSSATVSYVLSGKGEERRIPLETQTLVLEAADKLGYKRSNTNGNKKKNLQIAFYWQNEGFELVTSNIFQAISRVVSFEHININVIIRPYNVGHLCDDEFLFSSNHYDGAILTGINGEDIHYLTNHIPKIPIVVINRDIPGFSSVSIDNDATGRMAALHALQVGGKDIAAVFNPASYTCMTHRGKAFLETCNENGVDLSDSIYYCSNQIDSGYAIGQEMILKNAVKKVIFCNLDVVALGLLSAFYEAGITVGKDVQVFSASNGPSRLMARSIPPLTVVDMKMEETVERSLRMMIAILTQNIKGEQKQVIHPTMIYRQSSPVQHLL